MISKKLIEIETSIYCLSPEEQKWLLDRINKRINLENQIKEMANDPEIQAEIAAINQEFSITEMDGLSDL